MAYQNLPGVFSEKVDGGLDIFTPENVPTLVVLGTAAQGEADRLVRVQRAADIVASYGLGGTLTRGMYEVKDGGARNVRVYRIGATAAVVKGVGNSAYDGSSNVAGYTIETSDKDDTAGSLYTVYFDDDTGTYPNGLLKIWRVSDGFLVFSNEPSNEIDTLDVVVSGSLIGATVTSTGFGIDSATGGVVLSAIGSQSGFSYIAYTAGTDGTDPSRMELYEYLEKAYRALENDTIDTMIPMDAYLDTGNVIDYTTVQLTALGLNDLTNAYPTEGDPNDLLGQVYVEEYEGETYFFWRTSGITDTEHADYDKAQLWPAGIGSASATSTASGTALTAGMFAEVNYAYQLANFCYNMSVNNNECVGSIGTLAPISFASKDIANWVGSLPAYTVQDDGTQYIASSSDNGSGLLGNKFMAGSSGFRGGDAYGGFIATDSGLLTGTELQDQNNRYIDIGKYLSIVPSYVVLANQYTTNPNGYRASGAPTYGGFVMTLESKSAPTNKVIPRVRMPHTLSNTKLDELAGAKYTMFASKPKGTVVSDAPTAARQDSDYQRLSTVRIVKDVIDEIREVADPFVGEANTANRRAALETAVDSAIANLQKEGFVQNFQLAVTSTPQQQVQGDATIELTLMPAFELRQITIVLSLSALL